MIRIQLEPGIMFDLFYLVLGRLDPADSAPQIQYTLSKHVQGDQLFMAVFFWYLVITYLFSVLYCTEQGTQVSLFTMYQHNTAMFICSHPVPCTKYGVQEKLTMNQPVVSTSWSSLPNRIHPEIIDQLLTALSRVPHANSDLLWFLPSTFNYSTGQREFVLSQY